MCLPPTLPAVPHQHGEVITPGPTHNAGRALVATHPAVPVVIHGLEVLLDDPKLHGNEEVTSCAVGCLHLLHKMLHGNFCGGKRGSPLVPGA